MSSQGNRLKFNSPGLFQPSVVRGIVDSGTPTGYVDFNQVSDRNLGNTSSFRYDPPGVGLRSTQQIPVDFSKFENHTFFQSAEVNVHLSIDKIVNEYPFDGTQKETETYLDDLTGFNKHVYDRWPKAKNFLYFSGVNGSPVNITGTFIEVKDFAGAEFPSVSSNRTGENVLDPGLGTISFEMQLFLPGEANNLQTVFQKLSGSNQGMTMFVSESASSATAVLYFAAVSGSAFLNVTASVDKGQFNHVVATFNRRPGINKLQLYVNEELITESVNSISFGEIDFNVSSFFIGSGSDMQVELLETFTPVETLSGALDEFRVFHDVRTIEEQKSHAKKAIFTRDDLKLYLKFNEPPGLIGDSSGSDTNRVCLDSSGNSLHSLISSGGFSFDLRESGSLVNPITYEKEFFSPVLFPNYEPIETLNIELLESASLYDKNNPNLITRLVPPHYLLEGRSAEAFDTIEGTIVDIYSGSSIPGTGDTGQTQIVQSLLYIWAKFFDEMKMYIDVFGKSLHVGYDTEPSGTLPDQFLPQLGELMGVSLPNMFTDASVEQFIDAENLDNTVSTGARTLQSIQNQIWRRMLTNMKDIIASKGTLHSVKSFIRTLGIDPDSNFRIREFGGPTKKNLSDQHEVRTEIAAMLDMSSSNSFIQSPFLLSSSNKLEPGFPLNATGGNSEPLLTSGSWTYEGIYRFPYNPVTGVLTSPSQSLMRVCVTGTTAPTDTVAAVLNVIAVSASNRIELWARPTYTTSDADEPINLILTGVNIFDGNQWNISVGRYRNDDPLDYLSTGSFKSPSSASYFLRAARASRGKIQEQFTTQSFYLETRANDTDNIVWQKTDTSLNTSGAFLCIGNQTLATDSVYLHTASIPDIARTDTFDGRVGQIRFWSQGLLTSEWEEHVRNFKSVGVADPLVGFNFVDTESDSFGRLRIDASMDQLTTSSNASGGIEIFDFSQNSAVMTGSGFEASKIVVKPETFYFGHISPKFDEAATANKVRARGFLSFDRAEANNAQFGPVYEIDPGEKPVDDTRFNIDFSIIDALDQDIINIFSTLEEMDNAIGAPELMFSVDYPGLEDLREVYFNRLTDKINLKSFFEFFKWFDRSIGHFIEALVPRKTKFRGVNFVIESHMLERAKYQHQNLDMYLNAAERHSLKGTILLQQFLATINRY